MKYYTVENSKKSIFKTFAIYYICMALFCLVRISVSFNWVPEGKIGEVVYSIIVQIIILFLLPLMLYCIMLKVKPKAVFKTCNFHKTNYKVILISIALGVLCFIINIAVSSLFKGILTFSGYRYRGGSGTADYSTLNFFIDIFIGAVLPGFAEEFLHRGILLQGTKHAGFKRAIVISSILFGLLHFNIQQATYAFVVGLIIGFVSVVSKNIIPAMIIHFMNNAIGTYLEYASNRGWFLGESLGDLQFGLSFNPVLVFIISSVSMIVVVLLLALFIWLLYKQSIIKSVNKAIDQVYKSGDDKRNKHIIIKGNEVIHELLENNTLLNLDYKKMDNPIDIVMPKEKSRYKMTLKDRIFLWGSTVLGGLITLFTYIWGLV